MPLFEYKVRDESGKILHGQMSAATAKELRRKLDEMNFFIVDYAEKAAKKEQRPLSLALFSQKVSLRDISVFSWQLYTMLDAGLTLTNALKTLERQAKHPVLKNAIKDVWQRVEEGSSFSEALAAHPAVFSRLYVSMVNAGEVGGVLDEMLHRMALYYERQNEISQKIRSALTYPLVLLSVSVAVVVFLLVYILPRFARIFDAMDVVVPLPTQILLGAGSALREYWIIFFVIPAAGYFLFRFFVLTDSGRYWLDRWALRIPVTGELLSKAIASRFSQTLSTLLSGGIPILTALDVVADTLENQVINQAIKDVTVMVGEGKSIAGPLEDSKLFPDMVIDMIKVGEETGAMEKMLQKVSEFYDREINYAIEMFTKLIEPVLIVVMTVIVGFVAISIFLPMSQMMSGVHG